MNVGNRLKTSGYLVKEEAQSKLLRRRAGKSAWGFERRQEQGKGNGIARKCWEE